MGLPFRDVLVGTIEFVSAILVKL